MGCVDLGHKIPQRWSVLIITSPQGAGYPHDLLVMVTLVVTSFLHYKVTFPRSILCLSEATQEGQFMVRRWGLHLLEGAVCTPSVWPLPSSRPVSSWCPAFSVTKWHDPWRRVCKAPVNSRCDCHCPGCYTLPLVHTWPLQLFQQNFFYSPAWPGISPTCALHSWAGAALTSLLGRPRIFLNFKLFGFPQSQTINGFKKNYDFVVCQAFTS